MRYKLARLGVVAILLVPAAAGVACDKEDQRDAEEIGNDIDKGVDKLDSDGKDD